MKNNIDIARDWGVVHNRAELVTLIDWTDDGEEHGDRRPAQLANIMRLCVEAGKDWMRQENAQQQKQKSDPDTVPREFPMVDERNQDWE